MQEYKMSDDDGNVRYYDPVTGEVHRLDGPAVLWADGSVEYYIEGEKYSRKAFEAFLAMTAPIKENDYDYD